MFSPCGSRSLSALYLVRAGRLPISCQRRGYETDRSASGDGGRRGVCHPDIWHRGRVCCSNDSLAPVTTFQRRRPLSLHLRSCLSLLLLLLPLLLPSNLQAASQEGQTPASSHLPFKLYLTRLLINPLQR